MLGATVFQSSLILFLPKTPRWLYRKGRVERETEEPKSNGGG
jgi:hypothetical protein